MPSTEHQWLVLWIARKMATDGYLVCGYHGPTPQGGPLNWLPIPPVFKHIRPDVLAIKSGTKAFAVGEAKTASDLQSVHSQSQFRVLRDLKQIRDWSAKIYVAVPRSATRELDIALARTGLAGNPDVVRLHIPDCLVSEGSAVFA